MLSLLLGIALALPSSSVAPQAQDEAQELARWAADREERLAWWREARFGMFVHWGLYSAAGGAWEGKVYPQHYAEWIQNWAAVPSGTYAAAMKPRFQPEPGCTEEWAKLAADAGMRYAVMTSKHHDGFTLFRSSEPYSLENPITGGTNISPKGRDLAREFADSMRKHGLRPGFYYSLLDWQHPDAFAMALPVPAGPTPRDPARYRAYVRAHVNELVSNYGELATLWFDYSDAVRQGAAWGAAELLADLRAKQPSILVNNRLYNGLENQFGDYGTPEKYVPPTGLPEMDWEVNHTLNESYGFSAHDVAWKDTTTVVRLLCDIVSKGGNLLLNIGPDARGHVPEEAQRTLRGVGSWMRTNGEAIYGTHASPFARLPWGRATQKSGRLHLMVFDWPADGRLAVPMRGRVKSARLLGSEAKLECSHAAGDRGGLEIQLSGRATDPACSVIALELEGEVEPLPFAVTRGADGNFVLQPHDATLTGPSLRVEQSGSQLEIRYNLGYWLDVSATARWPLALEGTEPVDFEVAIELACADASAGAELELVFPNQTLVFAMPATGGWQSYRSVELGSVKLAAGSQDCLLRARSKPGEAVGNVRAIRLRRRG